MPHCARSILVSLLTLVLVLPYANAGASTGRIAIIYGGGETGGPAQLRCAADSQDTGVQVDVYAPGPGGLALTTATDLASYDLIFLDAAADALALSTEQLRVTHQSTRLVAVNDASAELGNVALEQHPDLSAYWSNRSPENDAALISYLTHRIIRGDATTAIAAPIIYADQSFYHPDADTLFTSLEAYLDWYAARSGGHRYDPTRYTVGLATHRSAVQHDNKAHIDALLREVERRGENMIVLLSQGGVAFDTHLRRNGAAVVDVLLFAGEVLDHRDRAAGQAQARALGVPILMALTAYQRTAAEYRASPGGLAPELTPRVVDAERDGMLEPVVISANADSESGSRRQVPMADQVSWRIDRALAWAKLRRAENASKRVVFTFWSEAGGKSDVGGDPDDFLDVPGTLATLLPAMRAQGYDVGAGPLPDAETIAARMAREASNMGGWSAGEIASRVGKTEMALLPEAVYAEWFAALPAARQQEITAVWGPPPGRTMVHTAPDGQRFLVIPRLTFGKVTLAPHPMWGYLEDEKVLLSKDQLPPHHQYLAFFLWLQKEVRADAWVSLFSNLSLQPGKSQGPLQDDHVGIMLGATPHIHPERLGANGGMGAKRKLLAQTVGWYNIVVPSDSSEGLAELRALIGRYRSAPDTAMQEAIAPTLREAVSASGLARALQLDPGSASLPTLLAALDDYFIELEAANMPWGGKVLGTAPTGMVLDAMVAGMLGRDLEQALAPLTPAPELHLRPLVKAVLGGAAADAALQARLGRSSLVATTQLAKAQTYADLLATAPREVEGIFLALAGQWIEPGPMGEPFRRPEVLPPGRALYNFDQRRIPTPEAEAVGIQQAEALLATHLAANDGEYPDSLAMVLWASELAKHNGVSEAQVLHLMGTRVVRNWRGEVTGVELIPRAALGRPRVDVLVTTSGSYRNHFQDKVALIAEAARLASESREADNHVAAATRETEATLLAAGESAQRARQLALARVFSPAPGAYSPSIQFLAKSGDQRGDEAMMADLYTRRLSHAYGGGLYGDYTRVAFESRLKRMDGAVLPRSSDVNGLLDQPMSAGFLGGLNLAAKVLTGANTELYISNLRDLSDPGVESAAKALQTELRTRYFNPKWLRQNITQGYDGARNFMLMTDHLDLWNSTASQMVSSADWSEVRDVFVDDKFQLGMDAFFDRNNPFAQQMLLINLLGAAQREHWQASAEELAAIARRLAQSVIAHGPACEANQCRNPAMTDFVAGALAALPDAAPLLEGYQAAIERALSPQGATGAAPEVTGQVMEEQRPPAPEAPMPMRLFWWLLALGALALFAAGWLRGGSRLAST